MKSLCFALLLLIVGLQNLGMGFIIREQREHIQVLEDYIQKNNLPVPAYPVPDGPVVLEVKVPVCQ